MKALASEQIPVVRRKSGGGSVYHDLGNCNYSIIMPRDEFDRQKNARLISRSLNQMDIPSLVNKRHDVVIGGLKVSGSAFKIANKRAYHHGTMLIDSDLDRLGRLLKGDKEAIRGKGVESVPSPVTRLRDFSFTADQTGFYAAAAYEFRREYCGEMSNKCDIESMPGDASYFNVDDFLENKDIQDTYKELKSWDWIFGQTPEFSQDVVFGKHAVECTVVRGIIDKVTAKEDGSLEMASGLSKRLVGQQFPLDPQQLFRN